MTSTDWYADNPGKKAEHQKRWREKNRERQAEYLRVWRKRHPLSESPQDSDRRKHERARQAVGRAVRAGKMIRPKVCENCGIECKPAAHHAWGYDVVNRYRVQWLCSACHGVADSKIGL